VVMPIQLHRSTGHRESWTVFSPCRTWRYRWVRVWDPEKPRLSWVIRNGSDADERHSDPTIHRCINFARAWGYGGVDIAHLYGLVSQKPDIFTKFHSDPVGPDNDIHLTSVCSQSDLTVLAWGPDVDPDRGHAAFQTIWQCANYRRGSLAVLDWTYDAQPLHPLQAPADAALKCLTLNGPGYGFHEAEDPRWGYLAAGAV